MDKFVIKKRRVNPDDNVRPISTSTRGSADEDNGINDHVIKSSELTGAVTQVTQLQAEKGDSRESTTWNNDVSLIFHFCSA